MPYSRSLHLLSHLILLILCIASTSCESQNYGIADILDAKKTDANE